MEDSQSWLPYMAKTHNYNQWIVDLFWPYVGNRVLEIGSGFGTFTKYLLNKEKVFALEIDNDSVSFLKNKFKNQPQVEVIKGDLLAAESLPKEMDTIICLH